MTVGEIAKKLNLVQACEGESSAEVSGCHIGDLLSVVMSRAKKGDAWITVQGNVNVVAVASLNECAMVIICEGMQLDEAAKKRSETEGICIFSSEKSAYELAVALHECL